MAHVVRAFHPAEKLPVNSNELRGLYNTILADKRVLLLLDNASDSQQVEPLLPPAGCSLIITSRLKFILPGLAEKDLDILPQEAATFRNTPLIGSRRRTGRLGGFPSTLLCAMQPALWPKKGLKFQSTNNA